MSISERLSKNCCTECEQYLEQGLNYTTCDKVCTFKEDKAFQLLEMSTSVASAKKLVEDDRKYGWGVAGSVDLMPINTNNTTDMILVRILQRNPEISTAVLSAEDINFMNKELGNIHERLREGRHESH